MFAIHPAALLALLVVTCAAITVIDIRTRTIPDGLNFSVALLGVTDAALRGTDETAFALLSGLFGAAVAWLVRHGYRRWRGFDGLGLGDVKFFGAAGIWVGWPNLPYVILIAAGTALAVLGVQHLAGRSVSGQTSLPFGPFIAIGLLAALMVTPPFSLAAQARF